MANRWFRLATLIVATLTVIHCKQIQSSQIQGDTSDSKVEDLCPCLPVDLCPRVFGTKPEDAKYFGDIKKCDDDDAVRCCGASASFVVGNSKVTTEAPKVEMKTTEVTQSDISSRFNAVNENEILDAEIESDHAEVSSANEAENVANFQRNQLLNEEVDEEAAESQSVSETSNNELQNVRLQPLDSSTEIGESGTEFQPTPKSHRKPKNLDNVMMVYPNFMSGIPKTTPKNMPETNEMTMFDEEIGKDVHLVFSKTAINTENPVKEKVLPSSTTKPRHRFAKRRKQFRLRPTTEAPFELEPTTVSGRNVTKPSSRVRNFNLRSSHQDPTNSTRKLPRVRSTTTSAPVTQEEEILHTSEDDRSHETRSRLFNARHRLNYLRRTTTTTTTTTESPLEITTRQSSQSRIQDKKRPSRVNDNSSNIPNNDRPSKMNETLVRVMDANHRNMISKVRVALKAATTENQVIEIPRSFASVEMDNRIKKIEKMLVSKMINVFTETKTKRRGDRPQSQEVSNVQNDRQTSTTEISKSASTQTYRGNKKFQMSDLLDKTLIVLDEVTHMRVRSTTVRPVEQVVEDVTTRRSRRRPTTTTRPIILEPLDEEKEIRDSNLPGNKGERNFRGRVSIRRKLRVEPSSTTTTTISPPIPTTTEGIPSIRYFTTNPSISTVSTKTISTPEATTQTQTTINSFTVLNESQVDIQEELHNKLADKSQNETHGESQNETQDESTQNKDIEASTAANNPRTEDTDLLYKFKPSPLWSITTDERTDFNDEERNHSYEMDMDTLRSGHRRSRTTRFFESPPQYLNGFVPVTSFTRSVQIVGPIPKPSKLGDEVKYNLPRDSKAHFSKN